MNGDFTRAVEYLPIVAYYLSSFFPLSEGLLRSCKTIDEIDSYMVSLILCNPIIG